nr:hypothetical protein [Tanacetum cinerariifolium]
MQEEKVPSFLPIDDPLERLNKAMALFRSAITSRYPSAIIQEGKVDMGKALDVSLVVIESTKTESEKQDTSSRSRNDADTYKDLYGSINKTRVETKDHNDSLIVQQNNKSTKNANLNAQLQEKVFAIAALKNELRKLKGNSVNTKFAKPSVLGKPVLKPLRNQ